MILARDGFHVAAELIYHLQTCWLYILGLDFTSLAIWYPEHIKEIDLAVSPGMLTGNFLHPLVSCVYLNTFARQTFNRTI